MLPYADDGPAGGAKGGVVGAVAADVPLELRFPVLGVRTWMRGMFGTSMPEAAIYEDGDASGPEDKVGSHAPAGDDQPAVDAVTQASRMKG